MVITAVPLFDAYTAFDKSNMIAAGTKHDLRNQLGIRAKSDPAFLPLIFEDATGRQVDFDLTVTEEVVVKAPVGRPKLGVVAREVTLLPRHWSWLDSQSGGASSRLRFLVEAAMKDISPRERIKQSQENCARFLSAMAGNLANYEEATRALYRRDEAKFWRETADWPVDIRKYAARLAEESFGEEK